MKIIVITTDTTFDGEARLIETILRCGADRVHLRKPSASAEETARLIESLPAELRPQLSLHDHHFLALRYGVGVHLNARNPLPPAGFGGTVSRSCHSAEELRACGGEDYLFLSPIYDSISKAGYRSGFAGEELHSAAAVAPGRVVALGGVTPERLQELSDAGFAGAAFLGFAWGDRSESCILRRMEMIASARAMLRHA